MERCTEHLSMNYRLKNAGIKTIGVFIKVGKGGHYTYDGKIMGAWLEYKGKQIQRPFVQDCISVVKREFGIDI